VNAVGWIDWAIEGDEGSMAHHKDGENHALVTESFVLYLWSLPLCVGYQDAVVQVLTNLNKSLTMSFVHQRVDAGLVNT
jgi:hypothetical protein